ncbi:trp operon repressor [Ferrimonas pelagia]
MTTLANFSWRDGACIDVVVYCAAITALQRNITMDPRWNNLLALIANENSAENLDGLLSMLLSHDERHAVAGRLAVFKALLQGEMSQRQMSVELGVSIATITRASNNLKSMSDEARLALSRMLQVS